MSRTRFSAGILLVRVRTTGLEFLLVHPGGPLWANKDLGAWSIPKGEYGPDDDPLAAARREFTEELGAACPTEELVDLGEIVQAGGKRVRAWCGVSEFDVDNVISNMFEMEWPPRSGRRQSFPEIDRAAWFPADAAATKILAGQLPFVVGAGRAFAGRCGTE